MFDQICRLNFTSKLFSTIVYALGYDLIVSHCEHTPSTAARLIISELNEILDDIILKTSYDCTIRLVFITIPEVKFFIFLDIILGWRFFRSVQRV